MKRRRRLVGPRMNAVAVELTPERLIVHFAFSEIGEDERESAEDAADDLGALLDNVQIPANWRIDTELYTGGADDGWPGINARRVFEVTRP